MLTTKSLLDTDFLPLKGSDSIDDVLERMNQQNTHHLPVVDSTTSKLIGQVTYQQLKKAVSESVIAELDLQEVIKVFRGQHIFEGARLMLQYELQQIPVVDEERTYLGIIDRPQVFELLCQMLNLTTDGSVISIRLPRIDFSLSEIVHLIETEDAKILGLTVEMADKDHQKMEISIKLNLQNVSHVTAALHRYGYTVLTDSSSQVFGNDLEDKAEELLNYIDM